MWDLKANMHQIRFLMRLRPYSTDTGEITAPQLYLRGLLLRRREEREREGGRGGAYGYPVPKALATLIRAWPLVQQESPAVADKPARRDVM